MRKIYKTYISLFFLTGLLIGAYFYFGENSPEVIEFKKIRSSSSPKAGVEMKKGREDYFFKMLRDPASNRIPAGIRSRELQFSKILTEKNALHKTTSALTWKEAGPNDVGGRTRALAVDVANSNVIIAGGISGGIWKSTDKGSTWSLKSSSTTILSVTALAQDPRSGSSGTWYFGGGETVSNSAAAPGAIFTSDGIYKSTDNGETWQVLQSTLSSNVAQWDSDFDFVLNIAVSPVNGYVFVATRGGGIFRSTDGGNSFNMVLGGLNQHIFSDIAVASNGNLLAALSIPFNGFTPTNTPGLYKSTDNGGTWSPIPVNTYPNTSLRSVLRFAPSNPNVAYLLTLGIENNNEIIKFYKVNFSGSSVEDRTSNMPDFSNEYPLTGAYNSQGGYDMVVAVKPDDENFVLIGGTSIYRSTDGFATKPTNAKTTWIGGYYPTQGYALYPNSHPDIHSFAFDPTDSKKVWFGHDGGLSYAEDITNTSYPEYFPWEKKNNKYNVTQFYHISIKDNAGDNRIMGGCQDNGTPFFTFDGSTTSSSMDVSSGDGSFSYYGNNFAYVSTQNGNVDRLNYNGNGMPDWQQGWTGVTPQGSTDKLFVHPFAVDPNNEDVMYYPAGNLMWRNNQLSSIPASQNGTSVGWTKLDNIAAPTGYAITTLAVSKNPANILYFGASGQSTPKVYKLTNSTAATSGAVEISITGAPEGAYVHNIAVNPDDANEILVVMSNYNIVGLYHSTNGGQSYTAVEGNLEGTQQNPGPSLRSATILPGTGYFLATSIGLFSTAQLNGNSTNWVQEGQNIMGNVVVAHVTSRKSDGRVVAGTHGRGAFVGTAGGGGAAILNSNITQLNIDVFPGLTRTKEFTISNPGGSNLSYNISVVGGPPGENEFSAGFPNQKSILQRMQNSDANFLKSLPNTKTSVDALSPKNISAAEELILDDGDALPDGFFGAALAGYNFYWANEFKLDKDFALEKIRFYMKTESASSNSVGIDIQSSNGTSLYSTTISTDLSTTGKWYEFDIPQNELSKLSFQNGQSFYIIIASLNTALTFPAAYDEDAKTPKQSYWAYYEVSSGYWSGYVQLAENAAWLIRAVGNSGGGGTNQNPIANAQVSPNPAEVNQTVNFNGSGSSDPDGQITTYFWEFGDGQTSNQMNTTHSYSQAGQFNYRLTVTDDKGATNQANGQITVNSSGGPSRWTITPSNGNVSGGGSQNIQVTFNSQGLAEGNYQAQLSISSNAGNMNIPINIFISNTVDAEDITLVNSYKLEQNYPNPFNPSTKIRWAIPEAGEVSLIVYDLSGQQVATLIDEYRNAGIYETTFNSNDAKSAYSLTSGVYFYRIKAGNYTETRKFILLK